MFRLEITLGDNQSICMVFKAMRELNHPGSKYREREDVKIESWEHTYIEVRGDKDTVKETKRCGQESRRNEIVMPWKPGEEILKKWGMVHCSVLLLRTEN